MSYYETLSADADSEQHTQEPLALRPLLLVPDFGDPELRQGAEPTVVVGLAVDDNADVGLVYQPEGANVEGV